MSRLQLGLNVTDLDAAIAFYTKLFGVEPRKVKPGYANFAIANPPLKLVLFEGPEGASINHLGVEFETADQVADSLDRLRAEDLALYDVGTVTCCYARSDKGWVSGPDGERWEMYTVLEDADVMHEDPAAAESGAVCCGAPAAASEPEPVAVGVGTSPASAEARCC
jgi:catechol 2,3-dioxygenase-like lactoylglutathione lyase family enzyme